MRIFLVCLRVKRRPWIRQSKPEKEEKEIRLWTLQGQIMLGWAGHGKTFEFYSKCIWKPLATIK